MSEHKDPSRALEDEAETHREQLASTLSELRDRISPGRMNDAAFTFARENGGAIMSNFTAQVRDNPIPLLLIGAGLALFFRKGLNSDGYQGGMSLYRDDEAGDLMRRTADPTAGFGYEADDYRQGRSTGRMSEAAGEFRDNVSERLSAAGEKVSSQAASIRDTVTGGLSNMRETYSSTTDAVTARAADLRDLASEGVAGARDVMSDMTDRAGEYSQRARSGLATLATEQPLVLGALGLLAGAALAAMLPRTQVEEEYMGSTAQRLRDEARHTAEETYQRAKSAASKAVDKAAEVASQEFSGQGQDSKPATGGPAPAVSPSASATSSGGTSPSVGAGLGISAGSGGARPTETISATPSNETARRS
ncbi:MAG: hypothetical protein JWM36_1606 [Hyphomicrobiales bacterium]|jgi:ElaB/YqjD/DUF883 family membrane-anchored ribosome-binding protein|nr:hypothetical protein [Hyphomicrobiales bacterium]